MSKKDNIFDVWAEQKIENLDKIADHLEDYLASDQYAKNYPESDSS